VAILPPHAVRKMTTAPSVASRLILGRLTTGAKASLLPADDPTSCRVRIR
jgi:hypothetical protein